MYKYGIRLFSVWFRTLVIVGLAWGCTGLMSVVAMGVYTNPPFSHYAFILERMPFGEPPPPPPPPRESPQPEVPQQPQMDAFLQQHRLCALTRSAGGIGVGFIETTGQQPRTFFLMVGDEFDGYRVVSADYRAETVMLEKAGERFTLSLDGSALPAEASAAAESARAARQAAAASGEARGPPGARRRAATVRREEGEGQASYVERLRERREEAIRRRQEQEAQQRAVQEEEVERLTGEALQRHLRDYNLDLIRARGEMGPPLPIELTPEEDEMLVQEGVLPPED